MSATHDSHPIPDEELKKLVPKAETILSKINGKEDIQQILTKLTPDDQYRLEIEELSTILAIRQAISLYIYIYGLLVERTGIKKEFEELRARGGATSLSIDQKRKFISAYSFFIMAASIVARCEKELRKSGASEPGKTARLENPAFSLEIGKGPENDLNYALGYYVSNLKSPGLDGPLVKTGLDVQGVTRDFWRKFGEQAALIVKGCPPDLFSLVANATFTHGKFSVTGLIANDRKDVKIVMWAPVQPEDVIGDPDVTVILGRQCDRIAQFDSSIQKNPFNEFGGLLESILIDGPPGTGKTTRFKMMMTKLAKRAEQVGMPYTFKSITADQVKSEWYGKAAQLIAEHLRAILDPTSLNFMMLDDIDLIISPDRGAATSGADNDILKALMDFLSGTGTNFTGGYFSAAATNKPTASDEALRQRFVYRAAILGPQSWQEYADLSFQELKGFAKTGLLKVTDKGYVPKSRTIPTKIADIYPSELKKRYNGRHSSWEDIGQLCEELRKKGHRFTGRAVKNAIQVALARSADFDVPEEWFTKPEVFRLKSWEDRLVMVKALYSELTADGVMIALEHQFNVEQRYVVEAKEKEIGSLTERLVMEIEARERAKKLV